MINLLRECVSDFAISLLVWTLVFVAGTIILEFVAMRYTIKRARSVKKSGHSTWRSPVMVSSTVVLLFLVLPIIALSASVVISIERGATALLERRSSSIIEWGIEESKKHFAYQLGISDSSTVVDVKKLRSLLADSGLPRELDMGKLSGAVSYLGGMFNNSFAEGLGRTDALSLSQKDSITWGELTDSGKDAIRSAASSHCAVMSQSIRAVSTAHFLFFMFLMLGISALSAMLTYALSRNTGVAQ